VANANSVEQHRDPSGGPRDGRTFSAELQFVHADPDALGPADAHVRRLQQRYCDLGFESGFGSGWLRQRQLSDPAPDQHCGHVLSLKSRVEASI